MSWRVCPAMAHCKPRMVRSEEQGSLTCHTYSASEGSQSCDGECNSQPLLWVLSWVQKRPTLTCLANFRPHKSCSSHNVLFSPSITPLRSEEDLKATSALPLIILLICTSFGLSVLLASNLKRLYGPQVEDIGEQHCLIISTTSLHELC